MASFQTLTTGLNQLSCILSMVGSVVVGITWGFPAENRAKHGRILLLWLSLTDFVSSAVYFVQTFKYQQGEAFCKAMALLGIFFPVASFLWTDFIAYYLYQAVVNRSNQAEWSRLLFAFHVIAWSVSGLIILLVAVFNRAGRAENNDGDVDDVSGSNTGGWCWIAGEPSEERFLWEMIGGKLVEWLSCFVILPYLYITVSCKLKRIDHNAAAVPPVQSSPGTGRPNSVFRLKSPVAGGDTATISPNNAEKTEDNRAASPQMTSSILPSTPVMAIPRNLRYNNPTAVSPKSPFAHQMAAGSPIIQPHQGSPGIYSGMGPGTMFRDSYSLQADSTVYACQDDGESDDGRYTDRISSHELVSDSSLNPLLSEVVADSDQERTDHREDDKDFAGWRAYVPNFLRFRSDSEGTSHTGSSQNSKRFFTRFYLKLSAVPLVFFVIRLWGTLHIILQAAGHHDHRTNQFFAMMQAFFDPSQGFFNAVLFVFLNHEDRSNLMVSLAMLCQAVSEYLPCCAALSTRCASPTALLRYAKKEQRRRQPPTAASSKTDQENGERILSRSMGRSPSSSDRWFEYQ